MASREETRKRMIEETKIIVDLFLSYDGNITTEEMAIKLPNFSTSKIERSLNKNNKEDILLAYPIDGEKIFEKVRLLRERNLLNGKLKGFENAQSTVSQSVEDKKYKKLNLQVFFRGEENQKIFLLHLALTYRAKLPLLSELFGIPENEIYDSMTKFTGTWSTSLRYLFEYDTYNQELAKKNIIECYDRFSLCNREKDLEGRKAMIDKISDNESLAFKKSWNNYLVGTEERERKAFKYITDEEILSVLRFQLKYALTDNIVTEYFQINRANYEVRIEKLLSLQENFDLYVQRENLITYIESFTKKGAKRG